MPAKKDVNTADGFAGSVIGFSIPTFINMLIMGVSILLTDLLVGTDANGQIGIFITWTNSLMSMAALGLDQAFIRFYNEPPAGLTKDGLFRVCFFFSAGALVVAGLIAGTLLLQPLYTVLGFEMVGPWVVPLLFLNALFYLVTRYFNALFRMEMNMRLYAIESVLMQFFYRLFYLAGAFFASPVAAMALCSAAGLGVFAVGLCFFRRRTLRPATTEFRSGAYRTLLPYGGAIAPTAVLLAFNSSVLLSLVKGLLGKYDAGLYNIALTLSGVVGMVQLGFAAFWGAYMFQNYKTQQSRILRVHELMNLVILVFFALIVAFEDIMFWILPSFAPSQPIFPLMMLGALFTILCETTVYGNAIAKKPIFDTIGFAVGFAANVVGCLVFSRLFGVLGAAAAVAVGNGVMFLARTLPAQRFYRSIPHPAKTAVAILLAVALTAAGTLFWDRFLLRLASCVVAVSVYCLLYRNSLGQLWRVGVSMLKKITKRSGNS